MSLGPFITEQVYDPEFETLVANLCRRPWMYLMPVSFGCVCAYISGFDKARSGGPLMGLQPWLVLRANGGNNLVWWGLAERVVTPDVADGAESSEERSILALGELLNEFFEYRRSNGLTKIFDDYARWLRRQSWYTGPLRPAEEADA